MCVRMHVCKGEGETCCCDGGCVHVCMYKGKGEGEGEGVGIEASVRR